MENFYAHETALVDEGCSIGNGTKFGIFLISCPIVQLEKNVILDKM